MRYLIAPFVILCLLGCRSQLNTQKTSSAPRPNILWISTEDISPDLACYGDTYSITPNLDHFASTGARFDNAFSTAPVCSPSRSSIITGMYTTAIGTMHHRSEGVPPQYVKCFPEYLRAAGYYCTNNSKTDYNFPVPLTAWDECNKDAHWRHRQPGQPFFAVFNLLTTHESRLQMNDKQIAKEVADVKPEDRHDPAKANLPPYYPDTPIVRKDWARYHDTITEMDLQFAAILKQLEDDGLAENTIVFFWGDHGRCLPRGKRWLWDSGIRVPLIVRWPGKIKSGEVRTDLVSLMDLGATAMSLAGVEVPSYMYGKPILGPKAAPPRQYIYAARDRMDETPDTIRCVRDHQFKYIRNIHPELPYAQHIKYMDKIPTMQEWRRMNDEGKLVGPQKLFFARTKPKEELYDIVQDPDELNNLAGDSKHAAQLTRLREALDKWMASTNDQGLLPEADVQARMRPNNRTPVTQAPKIDVKSSNDGAFMVTISSPTPGASIGYTTDRGNKPHWNLYTGPVVMKSAAQLRAVACRTGYTDSPEAKAQVGTGSVSTSR